MALSPQQDDHILSVGELAAQLKQVLNEQFPGLWVRGEITGFKRYDSGHLYFTLKDGTPAMVPAVMWRGNASKLAFAPKDGTEVEAFGDVDFYGGNGRCQFVIRQMRPAGIGALQLQFEELKARLQAEGLFDASRKQPLPRFPKRIGIVTSPLGAAVRDVIKVLRGRWPGIGIVLAPVKVQGMGAAAEIAAAIERFNRYGGVDLLIVGRGGGSMEDLWAFNEEPVVRAIAASKLPVISAVGHEVDFTLADFVADVRAATPSNAAEIAVRDASELKHRIDVLSSRARRAVTDGVRRRQQALDSLLGQYGFRRVRDVFATLQKRIDDARERLSGALRTHVRDARARADALVRAYGLREFPRVLRERHDDVTGLAQRLHHAATGATLDERRRLLSLEDRLRALSPRAVLERGYTLVRTSDGRLVRGVEALAAGDRILVEFARGEAGALIETIRKGGTDGSEEAGR
ncbi:MAG: exodeoxyribonuclease VII large subunit [Candidatus Eisenbacteria bacterium]|nr:exodeoxyribonuclease VII large subunit [Candidatus Eisenbacteria bacterium]